MRNAAWMVVTVAFAACGGGTPAPQPAIPTNRAPPPTVPPASTLTREVCAQRADELGPVALRDDQVALRRGTRTQAFAELVSTRAEPVEVCMPRGERAWLERVTCAAGPARFERQGSVGPGGTCGSIIDLYIVTCPEKTYEVFMDMYMCPPGEG